MDRARYSRSVATTSVPPSPNRITRLIKGNDDRETNENEGADRDASDRRGVHPDIQTINHDEDYEACDGAAETSPKALPINSALWVRPDLFRHSYSTL